MNADREKLNELITKIKPDKCELCGNTEWELTDKVFQLYEFDYNGLLASGAAIPVIPVTCKKCGNTHLINAITAGIVKEKA